jgi:hypothetical protein
MVLTKKQQELLLLMLDNKGFRLGMNGQKVYKSHKFYNMVGELVALDLVRPFQKEMDGSSYQLTDKGIMTACILANGKERKKIYYVLEIFYTE